MIVLGLTGSIGMGKSTMASQLKTLGVKTCSADAIVHSLMDKGGSAVEKVGKAFPGVIKKGAVDRKALGDIVFKDKTKLKKLEEVLHPLVVAEENRFLRQQRRMGARFAAIDIPLLFETDAEPRFKHIIVASAPHFLQKQRVMKRPGMTEEKFNRINRSQLADHHKRRRADAVILTGLGKAYSFRQLATLLKSYHA